MSWIKTGNMFMPIQATETTSILPLGTYYCRFSLEKGFYLEKVEDFKLPSKIYGDTSVVNRWLTSYKNNTRNTGIILSGIKGSGKTLLSKKCAIDSKLPIIIIDTSYDNSDFLSFITNPELGNICIFIDEFEKVFSEEKGRSSDSILSLLDGTFNTHNLFIFTCNNMFISEYLINRPSRIRYRTNFTSLPEDVVNEVIEDLLKYKEFKDSIFLVIKKIGIITYDLLITLINEINLFNESAEVCAKYLNIQKSDLCVDVYEYWKGKPYLIYPDLNIDASEDIICISRNFDRIPDPEYCDEDYCKFESGIKGLKDCVFVPLTDIISIDIDTWEYKTKDTRFILKRKQINTLLY